MKFKIISTIIILAFLIALTILFAPRNHAVNEDGSPIDQTIQN